ncbi:MAG: cytochrome C [Ectothiorhodospiraceae bacterium]|nr:cytochrome C [Ectothiorhodospiraceae bacterium]
MTVSRKTFWLIPLVLLIAAQFYQPVRTNPDLQGDVNAPGKLGLDLRRSCYDCHSNETEWSWYTNISPFSWWIVNHVEEARSHMNFSEWNTYSSSEKREFYQKILQVTDGGEMPPWYYLPLHPNANLSLETKRRIRDWVKDKTGASTPDRYR